MSLKKTIKRIIPKEILKKRSLRKNKFIIKEEVKKDLNKYMNNAILDTPADNEESVDSSLIFHAHSIEKGLSHPNFRPNFGKTALSFLKENLDEFNKCGYNKNGFGYLNALSVLQAYKNKHISLNIQTPYFDKLFGKQNLQITPIVGGSTEVFLNKSVNKDMPLKKIEKERHSVRTFDKSIPVDLGKIKEAAEFSMYTPSVCNRQPWHLLVTQNSAKIKSLLRIQGGYVGYDLPPVLGIVTVDLRDFRGAYERNEAYIDGGLYLMNFLLNLTNQGLASCTLNMMLPHESLDKVRDILHIDESNILIAAIAIGNYCQSYDIPKSARKNVNSIFKIIP